MIFNGRDNCFGLIIRNNQHHASSYSKSNGKAWNRNFFKKEVFKRKREKPLIYIIGFALNNTIPIWQVIGTSFASATVFSSVFGLGLILLMTYSHYILNEEINKPELIGAILIVIGTTMVGFLYIIESPEAGDINYTNFFILMIIITILFIILISFSWKTKIAIAFIFGAVAGTFGGIDNVFKRMGLTSSNFIEVFAGVFRLELLSIIFLISFFFGLFALILTQVGFAKGADASKLVPMYNSLYIAVPVIFELIIIEGATVSIWLIFSIIVIIMGVFLMNIFKKSSEIKLKKNYEKVKTKKN